MNNHFPKAHTPLFSDLTGRYRRAFDEIKAAHEILWHNTEHRHFTFHDARHAEAIICKLEQWLNGIFSLDSQDTFILKAAIYLHDIGMQCPPCTFLKISAPPTYEQLEAVRKDHHRLSRKMVEDLFENPRQCNWGHVDLIGIQREIKAIALLCEGHAVPDLASISGEISEVYVDLPRQTNLSMLLFLLRLGDAMDAEAARVNDDYVEKRWQGLTPKEKYHTWKHWFVSNITVQGAGVFVFNIVIPQEYEVLREDIEICAAAPLKNGLEMMGLQLRQWGVWTPEVVLKWSISEQNLHANCALGGCGVEEFKKEAKRINSQWPKQDYLRRSQNTLEKREHVLEIRTSSVKVPGPKEFISLPESDCIIGANSSILSIMEPDATQKQIDLSSLRYPMAKKVQLAAYRIMRTPVTNLKYLKFTESTGWPAPQHWNERGALPFPMELGDHPVTNISFGDAEAYCEWRGGRLPINEEWEKAARGDDARPYPWGTEFNARKCQCTEDGVHGTASVAAHPGGASPYGVLDLVGNVGELVDGGTDTYKDVRGGSFEDQCQYYGLTWARVWHLPLDHHEESIGFRMATGESGVISQAQLQKNVLQHVEFLPVEFHRAKIGCASAFLKQMIEKFPLGKDIIEHLACDQIREVNILPYEISMHPVTNWQYWLFIQDKHGTAQVSEEVIGAFTERPRYWISGVAQLRAILQMRLLTEKTRPYLVDGRELMTFPMLMKYANHPVVGITLSEAEEYCRWLSKKTGGHCRLPSWEEWQIAARGDDGRIYPWGNNFDPSRCNCPELGLGRTSDVREFPDGVSPVGCFNISGNVFEWLSPSQEGEACFCGGSFASAVEVYGLTFFRMNTEPSYESNHLGFRVVRDHK